MSTAPAPVVLFSLPAPHVALVTLNRPQQRNAVDGAMARALAACVERVESDGTIRVAILAGADLREAAAGRGMDAVIDGAGFAGFVEALRSKPWIAAVNGHALGGGAELCLACDLAVAGSTASFGLPEVQRSLLAAAGGVYRLVRTVGRRHGLEMILTGDPIDAARALELGLVNAVVAPDQVIPAALALAARIAANAPLAVREALRIARATPDHDEPQLARMSLEAYARLAASDDLREGLAAFTEKRAPRYRGR
jgi:enoyl-CoA hydratase/carnithine racemase